MIQFELMYLLLNIRTWAVSGLLASLAIANNATAQKTKKAVFVIADGIPADVIEKLNTPSLKAIAQVGGYARAHVGGERAGYSETPTISAVGYNSLLTGTWFNKHNVSGNYGPSIDSINYNYWNIFRLFKKQYSKKKTAIFSTWIDNRTKLIGSAAKAAGNLQPDYYFDGLELDTVKYVHDTAGYFYYLIDEAVTDTASAFIKREAPDLTWVYLEYTDEMGHRHGNSQQMTDAIFKMDNQIGRLWEAITYREKNFNEDWVIYITTDHGRDSLGYNHGGQSDRERTTWIYTNAKGLNERFTKQQPGIVDIMPSIASFLNVIIPRKQLMEIDGVPLTGPLSATNATTLLSGDSLKISWDIVNEKGMAKIWGSATNKFKTGGNDEYRLLTQVPVANGSAVIKVDKQIPALQKIVIEMPYNFLNRWIVTKK